MASSSTVLEDGSLLSRLDRQLLKVESALALIAGLAVFSLMVLAVVSVGGRTLFNSPLPGYVDWIEQVMPLIALIGMSYCQREGTHIRMDILVARLHGRALWSVELIGTVLMLVLALLLLWGSYAHFLRSFDFNAPLWSRDSTVDIRLPLWPAKLLAPIGFFVISLRLMLQTWGYGRAIWHNDPAPVGVPLIETAEKVAAREAEAMSGGEAGLDRQQGRGGGSDG